MPLNTQKNHLIFYYLSTFSRIINRERKILYLSVFCLTLPMMLSFIYMHINPEAIQLIASDFQINQLDESFDSSLVNLRVKQTLHEDITMLNYYVVKNTIIAFGILFSGLLFGIGTLFALAFQGMSMGLRAGYISQLGYDETLWPFLIGHTSFELIASIISGWCGFKLGLSLVNSGSSSRLKALSNTMPHISRIMIVALFLFLFAAVIQIFWSSNTEVHVNSKYFFGICTWFILIYYLLFTGKKLEVK